MVLVTACLLLRWIHQWVTKTNHQQQKSQTESDLNKLKIKLKLDKLNYKDKFKVPAKAVDESDLYKELESVRAVLEIREEELKKLRREIDRSKIKREVRQHKETQTDDVDKVHEENTFQDYADRINGNFEWNLRGRLGNS